uniref:Myb domain protein 4r1 n=1 Tax=Mycena chlorophos TaxID=658473 RepID=A0ABQ0LSA8_MYCCL|nr:Myb domain protein 4r1 [Mycena chlorophos]
MPSLARYRNSKKSSQSSTNSLCAAFARLGQRDLDADFYIPGSAPPSWPVKNLLHADSPFFEDATKRTRYLNFTTRHPISSAKEIEALTNAVTSEWSRVEQIPACTLFLMRDDTYANRAFRSSATPILNRLNWTTIAEKVSDSSNVTRTEAECRFKWIGDLSPGVNRTAWTADELERLQEVLSNVADRAKVDWVQVSKQLGTNRLPIDCMRQSLAERPRFNWTDEMDQRMRDAVGRYGQCWALVAKYVSPALTAAQCSSRWSRSLDPALRSGTWTAEEDERLKKAVLGFGKTSWVEIASVIPRRNNEQCRERWVTALDKETSKETLWTEENDKELLETVESLGKKWKAVGKELDRPARQCQIRFKNLQNDPAESKPKRGRGRPRKTESAPPKKPQRGKRKAVSSDEEEEDEPTTNSDEADEEQLAPLPRPSTRPRRSKASTAMQSLLDPSPSPSPSMGSARPKPKPLPKGAIEPTPSQPEVTEDMLVDVQTDVPTRRKRSPSQSTPAKRAKLAVTSHVTAPSLDAPRRSTRLKKQ